MKNLLFALLLVVALGGCSCKEQVKEAEQLAASYVVKDEATYNELAALLEAYINNDPKLSAKEKKAAKLLLKSWELRIKEGKKTWVRTS